MRRRTAARTAISTHAPRTGSDVECIYRHWLAHISTHAPRTGSDTRIRARRKSPRFQPTLPARGATQPTRTAASGRPISTHAPRTGSDDGSARYWVQLPISTHAPRTGSDGSRRRPCGLSTPFQPTLPARGATRSRMAGRTGEKFQPTLPARGATHSSKLCTIGATDFNPRSPHGERRLVPQSAHLHSHFNPRSPHGERPCPFRACARLDLFQPTLPARGATSRKHANSARASNFNPRSPHGERR